MPINKVVVNNETKLDLSEDTVDSSKVAQGYTFHNTSGEKVEGTMPNLGNINVQSEYKTGGTISAKGYVDTIIVKPSKGISVEKNYDDYNAYIEIDAEEEGNLIEHIDITQPPLTTLPYPITISAGGSFKYDYKEHDNSPLANIEVYAEPFILQEKTVTPTTTEQEITPDRGADALIKVTVEAIQTERASVTATTEPQSITPTEGKFFGSVYVAPIITEEPVITPLTEAQEITPEDGVFFSKVTVDAIQTEEKSATPTTTAQDIVPSEGKYLTKVSVGAIQTETKTVTSNSTTQTITPTSGKFISSVTVNPVPTETKTATPKTTDQTISPTTGKYLSGVTVKGVSITAPSAGEILTGKSVSVTSNGTTLKSVSGSMTNNGAVAQTLDTTTTSYTVPTGYHNGSGTVSITTQEKSATPSTTAQTVTPDTGKVLSKVSVGAIQTETKTVTPTASKQTLNPTTGKFYSQVVVNATPTETKTATPKTTDQDITPTSGKFLSKVTVKGVTCSLPSADKIVAGEVASVTSNGTTLASVTGTAVIPKVYNEAFVMSANESKAIDCGFQPKFIWIGKSDTATPLYSNYYNADASTTQFLQAQAGTMRWLNIGTAPLLSVTNTGFTFRNPNYNNAKVQVIAIG